jgi:Flp pilus assembly protein TadD
MDGYLLDPPQPLLEAEHPFAPGELLDSRFRIVREVARGGMGIVYEAFDQKLERRIAIKCAQAGFHNRLPREVRNASEVSHPNVCKLYEIHTATTVRGEIEFLTMEFLEGETLAERLRRGPLPREQARTIAQQICAGLAEAHRDNVIHGDLKCGNIILTTSADGSERAVITDFGLARRPASSLRTAPSGTAGGTPDYMAPELWHGEKASVASDIFALGVILFEMVSGCRPNQVPIGSSAATVTLLEGLGKERLARKPAAVDRKWDRVLARCLDPMPARRFQNANEVARALGPRSRRWFLATAAAVALALLTGVFTYQRAVAPQETVRLAVLPFTAVPFVPADRDTVLRDAALQIGRLQSNSRTKLQVIPWSDIVRKKVDSVHMAGAALGATHALHGTLEGDRGKLILHAYLTDTRSGVDAKDWKAEYAPEQLRYAGMALAGIVSETLRLPPLPSTVNAAAQRDYVEGRYHLRGDTEVDAALVSLEKAVAADPDSPLAYAELSRAQWLQYSLTTQGFWLERAADSLRQAEQRHPDLPQVHIMAGVLKAHEGWYEQAATEFRRTIEIDPRNGEAYRRLGSVYEHNNQLEEASASFRQAIEIDPGQYRNHQNLGAFCSRRANYAEAASHFRKAADLAPDEPLPHFALAVAYENLGRFGEAEQELRTSIGLRANWDAVLTLGQVLMYQARDREAIPYLLQALSLNPQQYLVWSHLAIAYRRIGLPVEEKRANRRGLETAERELVRNPRSGDVRSHVAYLCARLGSPGRAESEIAQALQQSPNDANTRWMAIMTYESLGRRESALAVLNSASPQLLADLNRWPDAADLRRDPRFLELLASHQIK